MRPLRFKLSQGKVLSRLSDILEASAEEIGRDWIAVNDLEDPRLSSLISDFVKVIAAMVRRRAHKQYFLLLDTYVQITRRSGLGLEDVLDRTIVLHEAARRAVARTEKDPQVKEELEVALNELVHRMIAHFSTRYYNWPTEGSEGTTFQSPAWPAGAEAGGTSASRKMAAMLTDAVRSLAAMMRVERAALYAWDIDRSEYQMQAEHNLLDDHETWANDPRLLKLAKQTLNGERSAAIAVPMNDTTHPSLTCIKDLSATRALFAEARNEYGPLVMLILLARGERAFDLDQRGIVSNMVDQIGGVVERANLRASLKERYEEIQFLYEMARALTSPLNRRTLTRMLNQFKVRLNFSHVSLRMSRDFPGLPALLQVGTRKANIPVIESTVKLADELSVTLEVSERERGSHERTKRILDALAEHLALAIDNVRLLQESRAHAVMQERSRMAYEIHDVLAQALVGVLLQLDVLEASLARKDDTSAATALSIARGVSAEGLSEARRSIAGLRPSPLEKMSLQAAIGALLQKLKDETGIKASLEWKGLTVRLSPEVESVCYRVAQESVQNIRRHSRASRVWASFERSPRTWLNLTIRDNGVGFDPEDLAQNDTSSTNHFGVSGLNERVSRAGGTLTIESGRGRGTTITMRLPISAASRGLVADRNNAEAVASDGIVRRPNESRAP